jgi:hypothetical protein
MLNPWLDLSFKAFQLGLEAQSVIALRMRLASGGPRAQAEARRMVIEKATATAEAQLAATTAALAGSKDHVIAGKALKVFKKRVRANKRRLSRR